MAFDLSTAKPVGEQTQDTRPTTAPQQGSNLPLAVAAPLEAMQAFNNAALGLVDLVGVDTVNAVLQVAGSDKRLPRITDQPLMNQQFMDDGLGRDVAEATGEVSSLALGGGALVRQAAQSLPKIVSGGESVGSGVLRQMGQSTAVQDLTTGALAGAGQVLGGEAGEKVAGAEGRQVGELLGALTMPVGGSAVKSGISNRQASRELTAATPTADDLKGAANPLYKQIDNMSVKVKQEPLGVLAEDIAAEAKKQGLNRIITPKSNAVLNEIQTLTKGPLSIGEIDTMRKVANTAKMSVEPAEANFGGMMVRKVDEFLDDLPATALTQPDAKVGPLLKEARGLWSQAKKTELINDAIEKAKNQASGFENGLRTQIRALLNNKKKMKGFTQSEREALQKIVRGGKAENISKALGKFGFTDGQASSMLLGSLGIFGGASALGPVGGVIVPALGQGFKTLAQSLTRRNVQLAKELIAAGSDGQKIAKAYMKAVPKKQRKTEELTALLLDKNASLSALRNSDNKLNADAAYFASIASVPAGQLAQRDDQ